MFKLDLEKVEEPEIKLPTSIGSLKKRESSRKNIYFCFIDYAKTFDYVDHNKLWKILKKMGIPVHLTCLLRNLYAGQDVTELDMEQQRSMELQEWQAPGESILRYSQRNSSKKRGKREKNALDEISELQSEDSPVI